MRDTYDLGDQLLMVATDRISAYNSIMPNPIPYKGQVLTAFSVYWFERTKHVIPNHLITANPANSPLIGARWPKVQRDQLMGRAMLVKKAKRIDIECVARGYLAGSAWVEYGKNNTVGGIELPNWLHESQQLVEPIFTPAIKAASGHDENITFEQMANQVGKELAEKMRDVTMRIYGVMSEQARQQGIIMADTKLEFGLIDDQLILIDEIGTPNSSRYWEVAKYRLEGPQLSLDKQYRARLAHCRQVEPRAACPFPAQRRRAENVREVPRGLQAHRQARPPGRVFSANQLTNKRYHESGSLTYT